MENLKRRLLEDVTCSIQRSDLIFKRSTTGTTVKDLQMLREQSVVVRQAQYNLDQLIGMLEAEYRMTP
jgi:hypothetical protein